MVANNGSDGPINDLGKKVQHRIVFGPMGGSGNESEATMDLKFDALLTRALQDWPSEIDLSQLEQSASESSRYAIKGLYDKADEIEERYYGTVEEIILRNLHGGIADVLHAVGAYVTRARLADLRPEAIRVKFERHLRGCMEGPDPTFPPEDIRVGKQYFTANQSSET